MLPTSWPSQVTARSAISGEDLTPAMCASNAVLSSGSLGVNAAIQTDSGSRI
jgi:hypothetical protein